MCKVDGLSPYRDGVSDGHLQEIRLHSFRGTLDSNGCRYQMPVESLASFGFGHILNAEPYAPTK